MRSPLSSPITYSPSVTITLTHDCPWHCQYCGFRTDGEGLISESEVERIIQTGLDAGATEALLISGEKPHRMKHLKEEAEGRGYNDVWSFAEAVAGRCIAAGLWPHGNYGALEVDDFQRLRQSHVSMGVMLESVEDHPEVAPEKKAAGRIATIANAGEARVPFTTGLLLGAGESKDSRYASLDQLAALHREHHHLQEILLQPCVSNEGFQIREQKVSAEEIIELIDYWRQRCPGVAVQVPPNVTEVFQELLPFIDDIGGISVLRDEVNQTSPWEKVETYRNMARGVGRDLKERIPLYDSFRTKEWVDLRFSKLVLPEPVRLV
ncbi:MAG: 7,8-didemethyl-8-hydroxy-5-deazariboflavin synthase subunit CofG [Verrucomicrobiota bacterium]